MRHAMIFSPVTAKATMIDQKASVTTLCLEALLAAATVISG